MKTIIRLNENLFKINNKKYIVVRDCIPRTPLESICFQCALKDSNFCLQRVTGNCYDAIGEFSVLKELVDANKLTAISGWKKVCRR